MQPLKYKIDSGVLSIESEAPEKLEFQVGDKVVVWDGSYNKQLDGLHRTGIDPLFKQHIATVDAVNVNHQWVINHYGNSAIGSTLIATRLDLYLKFPNGERVYCASSCVSSAPDVWPAVQQQNNHFAMSDPLWEDDYNDHLNYDREY